MKRQHFRTNPVNDLYFFYFQIFWILLMYLCILTLPLFSFLSCILLGRFIGVSGACLISFVSLFASFLLAIYIVFETVLFGSVCEVYLAPWISFELFEANWCFCFDSLAAIMLLVVSTVSCFVHLYSTEYLNGDPHQIRFMSYLSLFTWFMFVFICSDNFIVLFFGWEGIGLASFLLIGFWNTRIQASKAAIKAMLINRIGDVSLALGVCSVFLIFKTVEFAPVFAMIPSAFDKTLNFFFFEISAITGLCLLLFGGVLGKSAQISLHVWLPDAMEGPTPVSALIHAATLVVAGVFLIIRCSLLFENSDVALTVVACIGVLTSFFAASVGLFQNDLKRVIAYSTCSQLGYMVFISGLSHFSVSLFHLANHAVFKALLFLSAGCIIHGLADEQDLRKAGGLINFFPVSFTMILIGSLALIGTPFLTGFYSKDCILELAFSKYTKVGNFCYFLGCSAAFFTAFYSFRLIFLVFFNLNSSFKPYVESAHEASIKMIVPLLVLGCGSIFYGFFSKDLIIGVGSLFFNNVFSKNANFCLIDSEFLDVFIKNIPLFFTVFGCLFSLFLIYCFNTDKKQVLFLKWDAQFDFGLIYTFLNKKWFFDQIFNEWFAIRIMNFSYFSAFQSFDKGFIEKLGPTGFLFTFNHFSFNLASLSIGYFYHSLFSLVFFMLLYATYFFVSFIQFDFSLSFVLFVFSFFAILFFNFE